MQVRHTATAVTTTNTTRAIFTIRLWCRRAPKIRSLMNISEVDIFDFLCPQEAWQGEQKEQKSASKRHEQVTAVSISKWKSIS
jgi:hypothetical protein